MHHQLPGWLFISERLRQGVPVMLMYVVESKGSSPGRQGFMMAVDARGGMSGSIGGGIMEFKFVELCRELLKKNEPQTFLRRQVHDKTSARDHSGMICSGEQTILFHTITATDQSVIESITGSIEQGRSGLLRLTPAGISFIDKVSPDHDFSFSLRDEDSWVYEEKTGYKHHLHIVGAGHCALALSRLVSTMDFYIRVYDDREDLNTYEQNTFAQERYLLKDYSDLEHMITGSKNQYVIIMTFGYRTDYAALRALHGKDLKFIGLLGSSKKVEKLKQDYIEEFNQPEAWEKVHAPVGLHIHSQTPDEIAISIAAQIIAEKNSPS